MNHVRWMMRLIRRVVGSTRWYVIRSGRGGQFDDGFYGWDGWIHDEAQIYREGELPYREECITYACVGDDRDGEYIAYLVGVGRRKPSVGEVHGMFQNR